MENFTFYTPTRIIFGKDTHKDVGSIVSGYGAKKILLHYGSGSIKKTGLYEQLLESFRAASVSVVELGGVKPNPELALVRKGVALCKQEAVDLVLAVGGGSAIDSAKLIAVASKHDDDPWAFSSKEKTPVAALPVGVVLTLAASGSEMSASCVISNEELQLKRGYNSEFNRPLFAICNPELTYTLPPYQSACGIVDILMHTAERYFAVGKDTVLTDRIGESLMRSVIEAAPVVMKDPRSYEARATLMWAGSLSHNDLTGCGRPLFLTVHQIEHELSGKFPEIAHGAGLAALYPSWMRQVYRYDLDRFVRFAVEVMQCSMNWEHPEQTAREGIDRFEAFFASLGMPTSLRELGISDSASFDEMAEKCTNFGKRTLSGVHKLDKKEIIEILQAALG